MFSRFRSPVIACVTTLVAVAAGCGGSGGSAELSWAPAPAELASFGNEPVWQQGDQTNPIKIYLEPYCRGDACRSLVDKTLPALISANAPLAIYDYPMSADSKSLLFSATGQCVAAADATKYPDFLQSALTLPDEYDNNVQIQKTSKELINDYDTSCIHPIQRDLMKQFQNNNPGGLTELPTVVVGGQALTTTPTADAVDALIAATKQ